MGLPKWFSLVCLTLAAGPHTSALAIEVVRVSKSSLGVQGNSFSQFAQVSADGRVVAFESNASNLVPGDTNGITDVFVYDRVTGATERVSIASDGTEAIDRNGDGSEYAAISADGRYVAFDSRAHNLVPGDTNHVPDVFVHDRVTHSTERVSVSSDGIEGDSSSVLPAISADGRMVAFVSYASNLALTAPLRSESGVFIHDRTTGLTEQVDLPASGDPPNAGSGRVSISADGRLVAFDSGASNLVGGDTNGTADIFVYDRIARKMELVSVGLNGQPANGPSLSPSTSADGRFIAFGSVATNLVPEDVGFPHAARALVRDRLTRTTTRIAIAPFPAISANGRYVAFSSGDVFLYDLVTRSIQLVSVDPSGNPGDEFGRQPAINADGRTVVFESTASNLDPAMPSCIQIFAATVPPGGVCVGDCNYDGTVTVDEILIGVNEVLNGNGDLRCPDFDGNGDGAVTVDEILSAVSVALNGCDLRASASVPYRLNGYSELVQEGQQPLALSGTFVIVPEGSAAQESQSEFAVTHVRLRAQRTETDQISIDGTRGRLTLNPSGPNSLHVTFEVEIDGQAVILEGTGAADSSANEPHPSLQGVQITGGGYRLMVFAAAEL